MRTGTRPTGPRAAVGALAAVIPLLVGPASPVGAATTSLAGTVLEKTGEAVSHARVLVLEPGGTVPRAVLATDAAGRFGAAVPQGKYDLRILADDPAGTVVATVRKVPAGGDDDLIVSLVRPQRQVVLAGVVRDGTGAPWPGVTLSAGATTFVSPDGAFRFSVPAGRHQITVWASPPGLTGSVRVDVADVDLTTSRTQDIAIPAVPIDVAVRDEAGGPVAGATVDVTQPDFLAPLPGWGVARYGSKVSAPTSTGGTARLVAARNDRPATVSVRVADWDWGDAVFRRSVDVTGGGSADITLRRTVRWTGDVRGPDGRLLEATVALENEEVAADTEGYGSFRLAVPPGTYDLDVGYVVSDRPGGQQGSVRVPRVTITGKAEQHLQIPLSQGTVQVLGPGGVPVTGASVETGTPPGGVPVELAPGLVGTGGISAGESSTDATGFATVTALTGPADIVAASRTLVPGRTTAILPGRATVKLSAGVRIAGTLTTTADIVPTCVQASVAGTPSPTTWVAADGSFALSTDSGERRVEFFDCCSGPADPHPDKLPGTWEVTTEPLHVEGDRVLAVNLPLATLTTRAHRHDGTVATTGTTPISARGFSPIIALGGRLTGSGSFSSYRVPDATGTARLEVLVSTVRLLRTSKALGWKPTNGWTRAAAPLSAPTGATQAEIRMVATSLNGVIYVDDLDFQ